MCANLCDDLAKRDKNTARTRELTIEFIKLLSSCAIYYANISVICRSQRRTVNGSECSVKYRWELDRYTHAKAINQPIIFCIQYCFAFAHILNARGCYRIIDRAQFFPFSTHHHHLAQFSSLSRVASYHCTYTAQTHRSVVCVNTAPTLESIYTRLGVSIGSGLAFQFKPPTQSTIGGVMI